MVPPIRNCYLPGAFPSLAVSSVFLFRSTLLFFPPCAFYPSRYSRVFLLSRNHRSVSPCVPHLHETIPQDLTLEDRDSVEVSHEFRNRLLTELHRRFEQINPFQSASNTNTFRNARGHREKEWTDFDEVSAIAFGGEKIPTCRNRVNLISGRQTKRLSVQLPVLSTLSTWDVWRCSSQGVCKYARKL